MVLGACQTDGCDALGWIRLTYVLIDFVVDKDDGRGPAPTRWRPDPQRFPDGIEAWCPTHGRSSVVGMAAEQVASVMAEVEAATLVQFIGIQPPGQLTPLVDAISKLKDKHGRLLPVERVFPRRTLRPGTPKP